MFVEINTFDANNLGISRCERSGCTARPAQDQDHGHGHPNGGHWVFRPSVPFHFWASSKGVDQRHKYPEGADPIVLGGGRPTRRKPTA